MADWTLVAVAMPAYNEHEGLAQFMSEIERSLESSCSEIVFVVVDDASDIPLTDGLLTAHIRSRLVVERNPTNVGHGPSALRAYREALNQHPEVVIHVDGDGQFEGADFPRLLAALRCHDVVLGARTTRVDPWFRRAISWALRKLVADDRIKDANTPLRAFRPSPLQELLDRTPVNSLVPHVHFSLQARVLTHRLSVVSVRHRDRLGAQIQGTTWGRKPRILVPPRRLAVFCFWALVELCQARLMPERAHRLVQVKLES